ncbi:marR family protein [Collimonas fungivorans]|uniref:MarR family protein n=1 Tax=Collimonas fungivorans TaxID=158899 RepID=A0A127PAW7_9BURK|nr:MarR family transcriptional regulator [Collimonas fungivorans]AMO94956.1 marR family protein [Collimonas fungivorans]
MASNSNTLEEHFSSALHNTARAWKLAVDRRLKYLGLSQASWTAVAVAAKAGEPLSQIELANRVGIEAASMVATIDRLVKLELVVREPSPHDRRVKLVVLTKAGQQLYGKVKAEADAFRKELLADVDKQQLSAAIKLLEHLQAVAEAVASDAKP